MVWDPLAANNVATSNAVVNAVADVGGGPAAVGAPVGLTKVDVPAEQRLDRQQEPDLAIAGKEHRYRITFGNAGPSDATGVTLVDALDFKQLGILGETFLRCEAVAPTDSATCSFAAPNTVTVTNFSRSGTTVVPGTIPAGNSYQIDLVVLVDPGYVLDAVDYIATDRATIATTAVDPNPANNTDTEDTEIIAEADLAVDKTDIFGTDPGNGFLQCDPVAPGGMITYDITVSNRGPSDAASVLLEDRLLGTGVVLDLAQVQVSFLSGSGRLLGVRDDGRIQILIGRDLNNRGEEQLGRLNTGGSVRVRIQVMAAANAVCGSVLRNQATVRTVKNYGATLEGANEVPAVVTTSTGTFNAYFDPMTRQLFWLLDVTNTTGTINGAQIQRGAAGINGPVVYNLLTLAGVTTFTPTTPIGGVITLTAADVADLDAGLLYINVLTTSFPNGQVRGQILVNAQPGNRPRTPTTEVDGANNLDEETTTISCPRVKVVKTVSYNGQCPGQVVPTINLTGQPVTFCFEITNTGDTFLDAIRVVDELTTRAGGKRVIYDQVITAGGDPKLPLAPGETVRRQVTVDHLLKDWSCGVSTDTVTVTAVPVNSGRTVFSCLPLVKASSTAYIEVPCAGVDFRIQLPVLDDETCETWIQVQNVGDKDGKALLVVWGDPSFCPPQAAGPLKADCTGLLRPGSAWSFAAAQLPKGSKSAVVYALNATTKVKDERGNLVDFGRLVCSTVFSEVVGDYDEWALFDEAYWLRGEYRRLIGPAGEQLVIDFGANPGEPLAVTVNRKCPDPVTPNAFINAAYTGISSDQEGARDPRSGSFTFYAPLVLVGRGGLSSILNIQNSGIDCTSLEIWFKAQDDCMRPVLGDVLTVSPGETVRFDPSTVVGPDWMGSAWIRLTQPLGIVVDTIGPNHFTSYNGVAGDVAALQFSAGDQGVFAPLIYNQMQGWDTLIQVQNHSGTTAAKVKVYFLDQSGGDDPDRQLDHPLLARRRYSCRTTGRPLPGNWREKASGAVESQILVDAGHEAIDAPMVSAVVLSERWSDAARTVRREAIAYNAQGECLLYDGRWVNSAGGTEERFGGVRGTAADEAVPGHHLGDRDHQPGGQAGLHGLRHLRLRPERAAGLRLREAARPAGGVHRPGHLGLDLAELQRLDGGLGHLLGARGLRPRGQVRAQPGGPGRHGGGAGRRRVGRTRPAGRRVEGLRGLPDLQPLHQRGQDHLPRPADLQPHRRGLHGGQHDGGHHPQRRTAAADPAADGGGDLQLAFTTNPNFVALSAVGELPIINTACITDVGGVITGCVTDPNLTNNCASDTDIVKDLADLRITKYVEPFGSVRAGQIFTYTIFVDNLGPSAARRAVISDTLLSSGNVSIQSCAFSVSQGGGAITQFTCTTGNLVSTQFGSDIGTFATNFLEPLTPDSQGRLRASFRLVAQQDIKVTNTARVSSLTPDPDMTNNFTETFLAVTGVTNLGLTKTATGEEQQVNQPGLIFNNAIFGQVFPTAPNYFVSTRVTAGRRIEYLLTVSNTGPSRAERVLLQDRLPGGVRIYQGSVVATMDPAGAAPLVTLPAGTCTTGTPGDPLDKLACALGTMQVGDVATLRFQVITDSTLPAGAVLENDALVTADTFELNTTDNLRFTQNTVLAAADMSLTKSNMGEVVTGVNPLTGELIVTDTANAVTAGMLLRYQLSATNNGPSQALNVTVKDTLPSTNFVNYLRAVGADCRPDDVQQNILFCNLGTIPAGGRKTFDIYVRVKSSVPAGTNLANSAEIQFYPSNVPGQPAPVAPLSAAAKPLSRASQLTGGRSAAIDGVAGKDQVINPNLLMVWDPLAANNVATSNAVVNAVADVGGGPAAVGAPLGLTKVDVPAEPRLDRQQEPDLAIAGREHRYRITFGNAGPSDATGVTLVDALDFKQLGILGETFLRCEPVAPTDSATCSFTAPNTVTVTNFSRSGTTVVPGTIPAGNSYQIDLVVLVDPGYVLDATDLIATDRATIATTAVDPNPANNTDTEDTEIIAEADLAVDKTDIFGTDPGNGNLQCDPVAPGGMITYDITVSNRGPSDAASVLLEDRLPGTGVVLDPAQVQVSFLSGSGQLLGVRDDGRIQILIGRDLNNRGEEQLGRLNTGGSVRVRIQVMAAANAVCGSVLRNQATVRTVKNYGAVLEGANEVPAVVTTSTGTFNAYFDPMTRQLFWLLDVTNTTGTINGAQIQRGAAGINGPVVYNLLTLAGVTTFTPTTPIGGVITLTAADVADLDAGTLLRQRAHHQPSPTARSAARSW